jgi:hypothetical protein
MHDHARLDGHDHYGNHGSGDTIHGTHTNMNANQSYTARELQWSQRLSRLYSSPTTPSLHTHYNNNNSHDNSHNNNGANDTNDNYNDREWSTLSDDELVERSRRLRLHHPTVLAQSPQSSLRTRPPPPPHDRGHGEGHKRVLSLTFNELREQLHTLRPSAATALPSRAHATPLHTQLQQSLSLQSFPPPTTTMASRHTPTSTRARVPLICQCGRCGRPRRLTARDINTILTPAPANAAASISSY